MATGILNRARSLLAVARSREELPRLGLGLTWDELINYGIDQFELDTGIRFPEPLRSDLLLCQEEFEQPYQYDLFPRAQRAQWREQTRERHVVRVRAAVQGAGSWTCQCQAPNHPGAAFCKGCGARRPSRYRKCKHCDAVVDRDSRFCERCGRELLPLG